MASSLWWDGRWGSGTSLEDSHNSQTGYGVEGQEQGEINANLGAVMVSLSMISGALLLESGQGMAGDEKVLRDPESKKPKLMLPFSHPGQRAPVVSMSLLPVSDISSHWPQGEVAPGASSFPKPGKYSTHAGLSALPSFQGGVPRCVCTVWGKERWRLASGRSAKCWEAEHWSWSRCGDLPLLALYLPPQPPGTSFSVRIMCGRLHMPSSQSV